MSEAPNTDATSTSGCRSQARSRLVRILQVISFAGFVTSVILCPYAIAAVRDARAAARSSLCGNRLVNFSGAVPLDRIEASRKAIQNRFDRGSE
jgi:hypothetical protein